MPHREEYQYDRLNVDDTGAAPSVPHDKPPRPFGKFRQFIQTLQASAATQEGRQGTSHSWGAALLLSFLFNLVLVVALAQTYRKGDKSDVSRYARLPSTTGHYEFNSFYGSSGAGVADEMWEDYSASGVVAIKNMDAEAWQLPAARKFPWDKDYSLYLISGMYSLHCLKKMRRSVVLAHRGESQMDNYTELLYCFDMIRQDILCHADDTPMYIGLARGQLETGEGQTRACRDWNKLEEWTRDNSACFAYINETHDVTDKMEQFKYCPRDSKFAPAMRAHFGFPDDWYEEPVEAVPPN